ncbi:hypothetical protein FPOAC2_04402 [Fusarium poae]|uniref:hypothetical protein n=1 Tax=Fusarium poae TaxID=36050 RepID=UPI001CE9CC02|nr:hypothetical protein FPOAC1_004319 [Fusarium poae]KAG8671082.1 hypothetical protein FPOAC1_004319 [Fusarium poae]
MRFQLSSFGLISLSALLPKCQAFSITETGDANALASAIFGPGIEILGATFSGASQSSGTFVDGPFGIGSGAILTSGLATGALPGGNKNVNNEAPGSVTYCGSGSSNAAVLRVEFFVYPAYNGIRIEFIFASQEIGDAPDPIGIFVDGTQYALDPNGNAINAASPYLFSPFGIRPPDSLTSYYSSSPPFWIDIPATFSSTTMVIAVCDTNDGAFDTGLLINVEACVDCDDDIRFAYVTTTVPLPADLLPYTTTIPPSGTVSGTVRIGVEESTTTTAEETTTTADLGTTTTTAGEITTTTADEVTTTTADESTTTTADETVTTTADGTTTAITDGTTTTTQSSSTDLTSDDPTAVTTQEATTSGTTETSTEDGSTIISSTQLPGTTTSTLTTSGTTTESSTIATESDTVTTTSPDSSTESTTGTETTDISDAPIDGTTTTSVDVETPSISSTVSTFTNEPTKSTSSGISIDDTTVPNLGTTTTAESLGTTTVQKIESSTNPITPSSLVPEEETSSSDIVITSTADDVPTPPTSTSSAMPSNLAVIGNFRFFGCLGSPEGYPSFELIGETSDMTTAECVRLGAGRAYIGIYLRSCYAADTLDAADTVADGRCDLPCPGDPGLFCGGVVDANSNPESRFKSRGRLSRRDAPPGILLTLYAQIEAISGTLTSSDTISTVDAITSNSLLPTGDSTIPLPLLSSTQSFIDSAITVEPSEPVTRSQGGRPIIPPFPTSATFNLGNSTSTRVGVAPIVTTVTYTVVDPNNPSHLTVTEFCSTLRPSPCRLCQHQPRPTVEMTTIKVDCNACGHSGENTILLEVPAGAAVAAQTRDHAAYQTHRVQHHEPSPYEQNPHPIEGDSQNWQKPRPQSDLPTTGDRPHEGDGGYRFDQPQTHHDRPVGAGDYDEGKPAKVSETEQRPGGQPVEVPKTEPKPDTVGGSDQPKPMEPTFHRRPGPASTPAAPNAPIVVVSAAVSKAMEGMLVTMFFFAGLVFLL